jgi:hypothetical protein
MMWKRTFALFVVIATRHEVLRLSFIIMFDALHG